jgi:hypothetical protein
VVSGADAAAWFAQLQPATQLTRWTEGDHKYAVTPRPLLPGEPEECPEG